MDIKSKKSLMNKLISEEGGDESCVLGNGSDIKIVILQRGWIFVGKYKQEGMKCILTSAKNVRTWGTKKGLGELAEGGPTSATKLDDVNDVTFHLMTSIAVIDCDDKNWKKVL